MDVLSRAVAAAVAVAAQYELSCSDPVVLHNRSNVLVHLRPLPLVTRVAATTALVRPNPAEHLRTDVGIAGYLHRVGAAVVPPADELPPGPHEHDGMVLTFWQHVPHFPDPVFEPAAVAALLTELHDAMRAFPGELSSAGPFRDVRCLLDRLRRDATLPDATLDVLHAETDRLTAELAALPARPLHGDAHPGNLMSTSDGPLWTDFEDAWRGPAGWDLACLAQSSRLDGRAALTTFPNPPDETELTLCEQARTLQGVLWGFAVTLRFPDRTPEAHDRLAAWLRRAG